MQRILDILQEEKQGKNQKLKILNGWNPPAAIESLDP